MKHVWQVSWQLANGIISVNVNDQAISGKTSSFCSVPNDNIPHREPQRTHITLITFLLQILYNHRSAGNKQNQSLDTALGLAGLFSWPCSRDALNLKSSMVSHMFLPDPHTHAAKNTDTVTLTQKHTYINTCIVYTLTHTQSPTHLHANSCAFWQGRWSQWQRLKHASLSWIPAIWLYLLVCTATLSLQTPVLINHAPPQTQP